MYEFSLSTGSYDFDIHILIPPMQSYDAGTVLDLPYNFVADGEHFEMEPQKDFPFLKLLALGAALRKARKERREARAAGGDRAVEGLGVTLLKQTLGDGAKARQERRQERRRR